MSSQPPLPPDESGTDPEAIRRQIAEAAARAGRAAAARGAARAGREVPPATRVAADEARDVAPAAGEEPPRADVPPPPETYPPEPELPQDAAYLPEPELPPDAALAPNLSPALEPALPPEPVTPLEWEPPPAGTRAESGEGPPAGPRRARRGGGPQMRRRRLLLAGVALALVAVAWFLVALFQPFGGDGHGSVAVTIPKGTGVSEIGDLLAKRGVVSSGFLFQLRVTLGGHRGDLKPGTFTLKRDMSYGAAIDALTRGPGSSLVSLTIPEGRSRREIASLVKPLGLRGDYLKATVKSPLLDPRRYGAKHARSLEGFLFPSTYQLRRQTPVRTLVAKQLNAFKGQIAKVDMRAARHVNLNGYDVVTIASLVEREAQLPAERPLVASVIYNRLHARMQLGIDATIRFATGNWSSPITTADLKSSSAYNTRTHLGLPPGPIGNPGLASLQAAAHPAHTKYLYYVVKPCGDGRHAFSTSFQQFLRDSKRYDTARAASGGRSPTNCGG